MGISVKAKSNRRSRVNHAFLQDLEEGFGHMAFSLKGAYYLYWEKRAKKRGLPGGTLSMQRYVRSILSAAAKDKSTRLVRVYRGVYRIKPLVLR